MRYLLPIGALLPLVLSHCVCPSDFREVEKPQVKTVADVEKLSDCQIQHYGTTLLATNGSPAITRALLERGAKPTGKLIYNGKAENGTALAHVNDDRVLDLLLAAGMSANAPVNAEQQPPLCNVTLRGSNHLLPSLLAAGANPNSADSQGRTPLYIAATLGNAPACQLLLGHGALPDFSATEDGATPLLACLKSNEHHSSKDKEEVVQILLAAGANVNARDAQGRTPLFYCTTPALAETLLNAGAELNTRDNMGETAFDVINQAPVKSYLLVRGASSSRSL